MKKLLVVLLILAGSSAVKAQQLNSGKLTDSTLLKSFKDADVFKLKPADSMLFKNFSALPKSNALASLQSLNNGPQYAETFYSRMPVAKVMPADKMPDAKGNNIDNMPIKRFKVVDPLQATPKRNDTVKVVW